MKTYRYDIYQKHECFTQERYDVKATTKEEANKLIKEFYETGDEHPQVSHDGRCWSETVWDTLCPVLFERANIRDENDEEIQ